MSYEYAALKHDEIRLIRIFPSQPDTPITCSIETARLSGNTNCRAVSYTWGPPSPCQPITLNGRSFEIRENLWEFLNVIRQQSEFTELFWI